MSKAQELWFGYGRSGDRARVDVAGPGNKVLLLGSRADEIAALAAFSAKGAGAKPILFDMDGYLANRLSGYFDTFDYRSLLYDAFRLEPPEAWHAQMVAAAYTAALDLSSEEEAIINSALQQLATQDSIASPISIFDILGKVEGFRGFYVDKLKGRIGSLRLFDAVDDKPLKRLIDGDVLVDFHGAPYPQAAELALALFLAKILALTRATGNQSLPVIVTEAHRVFRSTPSPKHSCRLLTQLLDWPSPTFLASGQQQALSPLALQACHVRVYSSDAWHSHSKDADRVLSNSLVMEDRRSGTSLAFVPRRVTAKTGDYVSARPARYASPHLSAMILELIGSFQASTRESIVEYLAPEFLPADIGSELDNLQTRQCLVVEPKDVGPGPKVFAFTVTEKGLKLLEELRR